MKLSGNTISRASTEPTLTLTSIERLGWRAFEDQLTLPLNDWAERLEGCLPELEDKAIDAGLLPSRRVSKAYQVAPLIVWLVVELIGFAKLIKGLSNGKPVGLLFALLLVNVSVAWWLTRTRPLITRRGEALLREAMTRSTVLREHAASAKGLEGLSAEQIGTAAVLFPTAMAFSAVNAAMGPSRSASRLVGGSVAPDTTSALDWSNSSSTSSCSSDSGSSSCSSDSGGSSGCGGCGSGGGSDS